MFLLMWNVSKNILIPSQTFYLKAKYSLNLSAAVVDWAAPEDVVVLITVVQMIQT